MLRRLGKSEVPLSRDGVFFSVLYENLLRAFERQNWSVRTHLSVFQKRARAEKNRTHHSVFKM